MALTVSLTSVSGIGTISSYSIKVDSLDHMFNRFVTQSPLPATSSYTGGTNFWLDMGMQLEQITITGVADTVVVSGIPLLPSKSDLENVCRTWWAYTNTGVANAALSQLTIASGQVYTVAIKNADFKTEAAKEDRWDFSIIFVVASKL